MLPENIFSGPGVAPQLRRLPLDRCSVSWESEFLRSLTHPTVSLKVLTEYTLSVDELVTNLGHILQLESIHLSLAIALLGRSELNASPSLSTLLPGIARIHLEEYSAGCLAFLTKFTYPIVAIVGVKRSCSAGLLL